MADDASAAAAENIAVCIRVRPLNEREKRSSDAPALCCVPSLHVVSLTDPETGAPLSGKGNVFQYDEIFDPSSDTHAMYERVGRRIVHSTLRGINGTIFAYGQTSSGKTYTMQGDGGMPFDPEAETSRSGLLQLAVDDIFQFIEACDDRDFLLRVSFVEIYNEVVKDLLTLTEKGANLKLREDPKKGVYVECQEKIITNYEDIVTLLQTGNRNRTVGHTAMNDKSSRSHSVFRIVIESKQKDVSRRLSEEDVDGAVLVASLNLVDLAGSESLRHTGAEGIRQREAGNINKSLLTLARVINALASSGGGGQNAPFRDSKLTRLLQNSLGGNTRTLIICCVTPSDRYIEETKSTLQFAARAKDIQTTATVNEVLDDQTQLRRLKREVHELRTLVNSEALTALKAENEALISEKNCNKTEMARLMGLILSSTSVAKANAVSKERKRRGKRSRETWGPGDFPADIKALRALSPHPYPRKRHSLAKENVDPKTLFCVHGDDDGILATKKNSKLPLAMRQLKQGWTELDNDRKSVFDLFAAVYSSYNDGKSDDPIAAGEANVDVRRVSLDDSQRARAFDVLARMVDDVQSKGAVEGKLLMRQDVANRCLDSDNHCSKSSLKVNALVEEMKAKLEVTQESLANEKKRCHDLETEKASSQQMAEEELSALRHQLETLKLKSSELQHQLGREKNQLVATISSLGHDNSMSPRSSGDAQENVLDDAEASRTFLQLAAVDGGSDIDYCKLHEHEADPTEVATQVESIAEEEELVLQENVCGLDNGEQTTVLQTQSPSESETISRQDAVATDRFETSAVEKLAGELQSIMQELAQLQSDHEQTAFEKEELQAETERMSEEIEAAQRHVCEMSEALMEKDHTAKVLQAQLDAKLMTISQMQTKYSDEVGILQQSIQDLMTENDQLLTKTRESHAKRNVASDDTYPEKPAASCSDSICTHSCAKDEALHLPSEVGRLTEQPVTDKSELFDTKQCLQATLQTDDAASCHPKQENDPDSTVLANEHEQIVDVPLCDIGSLDQSDLRYNKLREDFVRVTGVLDNVSRERDDCVEELRALESQLMEVSEEKMRFAVAANEQEIDLRKVQQDVLSSTTTIATLRAQLDDAESAKATLEARKTELEQSIEKLQASWKMLQADYAAVVEQMQERETAVSTPENDGSTAEAENLQQRLEIESKERKKLQLDVTSYEETLSVLREEAKNSSDTIADLLEKMGSLETDLVAAARFQEKKDKELASLTNALSRSKEELDEMRLQSKQRLVVAEGKEMSLEEKIVELEQRISVPSGDTGMENKLAQDSVREEIDEAREKQTELQSKITALENELAKAQQELLEQDSAWNKKEELAKKEFARLTMEQTQLRDDLLALQRGAEAAQETHSDELLKVEDSCTEIMEQKDAMQRELEAANTMWEEKEQDLMHQMDSLREQFEAVQVELDEYRKNADDEIHRLLSVVERSDAAIEELKHTYDAREKEYEKRISEQEDQIKSHQETLQVEYSGLEAAYRQLKEENAMREDQRRSMEEQLQNEIDELQQSCATAQTQQAKYQAKLKEMETQLEMTENEVTKKRGEMKRLANTLKAAEVEAVDNHKKLVEAQVAKESMEKLVDKQKARIDKLDRVKMTTETLELFRKLKKDRFDLQVKVQSLQMHLAQAEQAPAPSREDSTEKRLIDHKTDELKQLKEQVEELHEAVRVEKLKALHEKAKMRAALNDEREKAEHEIQEMQALVKEKMELVETLESQVASVEDAMAKLRKQKSENASNLETENLNLHVKTRELKKQMELTLSGPEKDEVMRGTRTYDTPAAAAAKALSRDIISTRKDSEVSVDTNDANLDDCNTASQPERTRSNATKAGGFLLPTQTDAIATNSQDESQGGEHPECAQQ